MTEQIKVIGYYKEPSSKEEENSYIVAFENGYKDGSRTWIEYYNIMDGHGEIKDHDFLKACKKVSKEEYKQKTAGWYTPAKYL